MPNELDLSGETKRMTVGLTRVADSASPSLLELAKERALDPSIFDEHKPFFARVIPSTSKLDSYFTQMTDKTLQNFAHDAEEGRAVQNSHSRVTLPIGYSLTGKFIGGKDSRVESDFYALQGLNMGSVSTDDFIAGVRGGTIRDISVGFHGGQWLCSICGRDMMADYNCYHWPGIYYKPKDDEKDDGRAKIAQIVREDGAILCTAAIDDAGLSEYSPVFDGATPGAGIVKTYRAIDEGRMDPSVLRVLEQTYRTKFPAVGKTFAPGTIDRTRAGTAREDATVDLEAKLRATLGLTADADIEEAVRGLQSSHARLKTKVEASEETMRAFADESGKLGCAEGTDALAWAHNEVRRLTPMADDGKKYRATLIEDALKEGRRAYGKDFAEERYAAILKSSETSLDGIRQFAEDWARLGDDFLAGPSGDAANPGGRRSVEGDDETVAPRNGRARARHYK